MVSIIIPRFDFIIILVTKMMNMHLWRSRFTYCNYMNNVNKRYKGYSKQIKYLINHTDFPIRIRNRLEIILRSLSVLNTMKHFSYNYDHFYCFVALISTSLPSFLFTRTQNGVKKKFSYHLRLSRRQTLFPILTDHYLIHSLSCTAMRFHIC